MVRDTGIYKHIIRTIKNTFLPSSKVKERSKQRYVDAYNNNMAGHKVTKRLITEIDYRCLQEAYNEMTCAASSVEAIHKLLQHFFALMEQEGICKDPTKSLVVPKAEKKNKSGEIVVFTDEELEAVKVPTVVIAGSKDLVDEKETRLIAESIPGAKLRILEGEGHMSYATTGSHLADIIMEETGLKEPGEGGTLTEPQKKILKGAQQGEVDAAYMYEKLAEAVDDDEDKKAFERLSADEARHADVFFRYTKQTLKPNPTKAILIPAMYKTVGKEKLYPIIAKAEYEAAEKYKNIIADFPEVVEVMNDEVHHGDAVMGLLK